MFYTLKNLKKIRLNQKKIIYFFIFVIVFFGIFIYYTSIQSVVLEKNNQYLNTFQEKVNLISAEINTLNQSLAQKISEIQKLTKDKKSKEAKTLINETIEINKQIKEKNQKLKMQFEELKNYFNQNYNSFFPQNINNAIKIKEEIIKEYDEYAFLMDKFLNELLVFISNPSEINKAKVDDTLYKTNEKINLIKKLNQDFEIIIKEGNNKNK